MEKNTQPRSESSRLSPPLSPSLSLNSTDQKNHLCFLGAACSLVRVSVLCEPPPPLAVPLLPRTDITVLGEDAGEKRDAIISYNPQGFPKAVS